ncbi:MAG: rhodanese-like domain-containing protein [Chloroflexi bacterium]|nr:MAG: rhodanese-like domain-containing protein [Chloroflexota bacterium]
MQRRNREHRHRRRSHQERPRRGLTSALRRPGTQIAFLIVVALVVFLILQMGRAENNSTLPRDISAGEAYQMYQNGAFVLDVRTQEEWNEYHIPNATLIPLDQLPSRLGEVPHDRQVVVVCRSGNRSQAGRDILLNAGFKQVTSLTGGLNEWRSNGYPIEP